MTEQNNGESAAENEGMPAVTAQTNESAGTPATPGAGTQTTASYQMGDKVVFTDPEGEVWPGIVSRVNDEGVRVTVFDGVFGPRLYWLPK